MWYPLSSAQSGIYLHQCREEGNPLYNVGGYIRLDHPEVERLRRAHARLMRSHEAFRIRVRVADATGGALQSLIDPDAVDSELVYVDLSADADPVSAAQQWVHALFAATIPIEDAQLHRAALLKLSDRLYWYVGMAHHLAVDGMGFMNWAHTLARYYDEDAMWDGACAIEPRIADIAARDADYAGSAQCARDDAYWSGQAMRFCDSVFANDMRAVGDAGGSVRVQMSLTPGMYANLDALADRWDSDVHAVLLALVCACFTQCYSVERLVVGIPQHGRQGASERAKIGLFTQMLPLVVEADVQAGIAPLLADIARGQRELLRHRRYPLASILQKPAYRRDAAQPFDFAYSYVPAGDDLAFGGVPAQLVYCSHDHEPHPLLVTFWDAGAAGDSVVLLDFNLGCFSPGQAGMFPERLAHMLEQLHGAPDRRMLDLECVTPLERTTLLAQAQACTQSSFHPFSLIDDVGRAVAGHPARIALESGQSRIAYADLDKRANAMAAALWHDHEVRDGDRVAVLLQHSPQLVIVLMALVRLRAVYVPIDAQSPPARTRHILDDCGATLLIKEGTVAAPGAHLRCVTLQALEAGSARGLPPIDSPVDADDALYVLYTSGSTGRPKGVLVHARAACNLLGGLLSRLGAGGGGRWLFMSSVGFDISIVEWLGCLGSANTCVIPSAEQMADPFALADLANSADLSLLQSTPSRLKQLRSAGWSPHPAQIVISAGEPLSHDLAQDLLSCGVVLWNGYGPTEATVYSLVRRVEHADSDVMRVAIGDQLPGYRHYVLNRWQRLVPEGVAGELVIAGAGLAAGYVDREELTARQFIAPQGLPEERVYRTGDLVRQMGGGSFRYQGRNDDQIKLRGYRIELGEIRSVLLAVHGVSDAAVICRPALADRPAFLLAYICVHAAHDATSVLGAARAHAMQELPAYMVPSALTVLPALPVNTNGKLDVARLPSVDLDGEEQPVELRDENERVIAAHWAELLGLQSDSLGGHSDFFTLGGDSVLAVRMVARLRTATGRRVETADLFNYPRLSALASRVDGLPALQPVELRLRSTTRAPAHAGPVQRQLWLLSQQEPDNAAYNMTVAYALHGDVRSDVLRSALSRLLERHHALRTVFHDGPHGLMQEVRPAAEWSLEEVDGRHWAPEACSEAVRAEHEALAGSTFDLGRDIPFRARLITLGDEHATLLITVHHIAADGASVGIALQEFLTDHAALAAGHVAVIDAPSCQFADFTAWQRDMSASGAWSGQLEYWKERLYGMPPTHALASPHVNDAGRASALVTTTLSRLLVDRLHACARAASATGFSLVQSALALTLCKWTYSDAIVIGSPARGRTSTEFEGSVGMFVNMLAYPHRFAQGESFSAYLARFQREAARALDHQDVPFDAVVEAVQVSREPGRHPVFQVLFAFQDDVPDTVDSGALRLQRLADATPLAKYELECLVSPGVDGWSFRWLAAPGVLDADGLHAFAGAFATVLEQLVDMPDRDLSLACLFSGEDVPHARGVQLPEVDGVHSLISAQARHRPDSIALRWGEQALSYRVLDQDSNRLARLLVQHGVRPGGRVALCLPRGPMQIIATLAVLKAGAAYVPINPAYPPARIAYLLEDAAPFCMLSTAAQSFGPGTLPEACQVIDLDAEHVEATLLQLASDVLTLEEVVVSADNDAYVIHTSGSTGQPKGVLVGHRGLVNLALSQAEAFGIDADARVLQFASPSFDAAVSEWSTTLAAGAELVLVPDDVAADAQALTAWALHHRVTHATLPPTVLRRLSPGHWPTLTHVISAGEPIALDEAQRWAGHCRFINAYGPSEATVCASIGGISPLSGQVTIGRAMSGLALYVVDRDLQLLPEGAVGELCIAGVALAKGYLNKPEQTRAAFVDLQLADGRRVAVYRTGDRVRRLHGGELAFEGRLDDQVKIRGHRIECGEVEVRLAVCPGVREVAVGTREAAGGDRVLVSYLALETGEDGTAVVDAARRHLSATLPGFMVPTQFIIVEALPLNHSGKVDHKALQRIGDGTSTMVPRRALTATETIIGDLWVELLGPQADDPDRGFFELGGHSLLISDVISALRARFGIVVGYRQFFDHPTIATLAAFVDQQPRVPQQEMPYRQPVALMDGQGELQPLSFEQQRLWFIDQLEQGSAHYNMPVVLELKGRIDPALIEAALQRIVARHESLRTTFHGGNDGGPVQSVRHDLPFRLEQDRVPGDAAGGWLQTLRQQEQDTPFDLSDALMIRGRLLTLADDQSILLLTLHHIAADGWSIDCLIAEFGALYAAMLVGAPDPLPELPLQYGQHAARQRAQAAAGALDAGLQFWRTQLQGAPACHSLPLDSARGAAASVQGRSWSSRIPGRLAAGLADLAAAHDTTLFVVLQAAYAVLVSRWSEHRDVMIGTPVANRHHADLAGLIGFFTNTVVLRTNCERNVPFATVLQESRAAFLDCFEHQHVPFDMLVEATEAARNAANSPLVQLLFSYGQSPEAKLEALRIPDLAVRVLDEDGPRPVKFDLELAITGDRNGLVCQWLFDSTLFRQGTIERIAESFCCLIESVLSRPLLGIHAHPIVRDEERQQLLSPPRTLPAAVGQGGLICERFEQMAQQQPEAVAVIHGSRRTTYAELDALASSLASWLIRNGYVNGGPVAVYMGRGIELVVALLAVMKSGATYLPIDPGYPSQRVAFILSDAAAAIVLCDDTTAQQIGTAPASLPVRRIDHVLGEACAHQQTDECTLRSIRQLDGRRHAYIVYTSGSTGQPKGVKVRQESFLNLTLWYLTDYAFTPNDRCLLIGSIGFDMTQKNVFTPLLAGAAVVVPDDVFDPAAICALVEAARVSIINCAPSAAAQLVEQTEYWPRLVSLRLLALGGEAIRMNDLRPWLRSPQCHAQLLNMYGPSECTDIAVAGLYERDVAAAHAVTVPIGRPIPNCMGFVLNDQRQLQPRGVVGELYIGGIGVSDGYINRDDLNRQSFIDDVLAGAGRTYRTGDLVRMDGQGTFHYIGRADHQVKIRGYRVETAEIDALVSSHSQVKHALTLVHEDAAGTTSLATCIAFAAPVPDAQAADTLFHEIRSMLVERLPSFIVPGRLIHVEAMPLTPNGKIDRAALQARTSTEPGWRFTRQARAPETETEAVLLEIWRDLLATSEIGVDDDFFELGGHSLLVTRLASRVTRAFDIEDASMSVKEFFENPTIAAAARVIDARRSYGRLLTKARSLLATSADLEEGTF
ncbi:non-ribosomal peptide synthetase [Xanthomonas arboricola]|uniref:non-ribosomal peptide synthetase n=1 Tax=Xanthomonas arboricola TaxID=56448 RepID=UPI0009B73719|nr:non-ribosomal peptide synthetase [Xanthomonas arboricola]